MTRIFVPGCLLFLAFGALAQDASFTNSLARADRAEKNGDLQGVLRIYAAVQQAEINNAVNLCVLAHRYCDLTYSADSAAVQKTLLAHALACSQKAVQDDPKNATAHASLAVCYARSCNFADIKTELAYSRLFKSEAEQALALDPGQDVAYYLLGRWNYGIATVGLMSRAYVKVVYGGLPPASIPEAIRNFKKACELSPNRILNHSGLAMAYEAAGEKNLEIAELQTCCALKPQGPSDQDALRDAQKKLAALK
jgi:tetratricopeptide (TPR) repeat protein